MKISALTLSLESLLVLRIGNSSRDARQFCGNGTISALKFRFLSLNAEEGMISPTGDRVLGLFPVIRKIASVHPANRGFFVMPPFPASRVAAFSTSHVAFSSKSRFPPGLAAAKIDI
ncbi:MAG: hypothetical protein WCC41_02295 [Rhodomicrobium sp.]